LGPTKTRSPMIAPASTRAVSCTINNDVSFPTNTNVYQGPPGTVATTDLPCRPLAAARLISATRFHPTAWFAVVATGTACRLRVSGWYLPEEKSLEVGM